MYWAFSCAFALPLFWVSVAAAYEDGPFIEQREVTFDVEEILKGMNYQEPIFQKIIDIDDRFQPRGIPIEQREVVPSFNPDLRENGAPVYRPRSKPPSLNHPVPFPPGRPTPSNLQAICLYGDRRPQYPVSYFPPSGFGQLKRRAEAVNHVESLYSMCCKESPSRDQEVTLCCVKQAWRFAVDSFCEVDSSIKDRVYHCCSLRGTARLKCFQSDAPNPSYQPTEEVPVPPIPVVSEFTFNPNNTCRRSNVTPRSVRGRTQEKIFPSHTQNISIGFPPGRPTAANIESVCLHRKLRPHYDLKCLPRKGYGWLARQSKALNRLETGFKQCCKGKREVLTCAEGKWGDEMDRYCREEKEGKLKDPCCEKEEVEERYDCFHSHAPHPDYHMDPTAATPPNVQDSSLGQICDTHKILKKKFPVGLPLQNIVNQCCPLSSNARVTCIQQKIMRISKNLCSARRSSSPFVACCSTSSVDKSQCITNRLMKAITKATSKRLRSRKCPLS